MEKEARGTREPGQVPRASASRRSSLLNRVYETSRVVRSSFSFSFFHYLSILPSLFLPYSLYISICPSILLVSSPVRNGSSTLNSPREKRYPLHASLRIDAGIILTDVISRSPYPLPLLETLADHWPPLFCLQSYYTRATSVLHVYVVEGNV